MKSKFVQVSAQISTSWKSDQSRHFGLVSLELAINNSQGMPQYTERKGGGILLSNKKRASRIKGEIFDTDFISGLVFY